MMIQYDFQMEDLKNDERFKYDDVVNINVYYVYKNDKNWLLSIPIDELSVLNEIMNLCIFEEDNEEDE